MAEKEIAVKVAQKKSVDVAVENYNIAVKVGGYSVDVAVPSKDVAVKIANKKSVAIEAHQIVGGVTVFTDLADAFASYVGKANKIIRVKNDETGLEATDFSTEYSAEADEDILVGQPVSIKSNGHLILGNASDIVRTKIVGLAKADCGQTFACKYTNNGSLTLVDWTNIIGSTELTRGGVYYLDTTNGKITETAPAVTGYVLKIGRAVAADTLWIEIEESILL